MSGSSSLPYPEAKDGVDLWTVLAKIRNHIDITAEDRGSRWLIGQPAKRVEHPNQLPLVPLADEYAPSRITSCGTRIIHLIQKFGVEGAGLIDTTSTTSD